MAIPKYVEQPCRMCGTHKAIVSGAWCRAQRLANGITLKAMAQLSGLSYQFLWDMEHESPRARCTPRVRRAYEALSGGDGDRKSAAA